jgi:protoporphyrin/coproporphyrin ferrochelatase
VNYDALLIVAFGGPDGPDDVMPFLENVLRGRNVPRERMLAVAEHYQHFGGVSPINAQVRALIAALEPELRAHDIDLPIHWGNRNWHPLLPDTLQQMTAAGVRRGLALFVSAYSSYSGCRQYRENVAAAREGVGPDAPEIDKLRAFYNHPDFIAANADRLQEALAKLTAEERRSCRIAFTAHSIPSSMAAGCDYERQLSETARLVAEACGIGPERWQLVYQSRSGRPEDPWLEPDVVDHLRSLAAGGVRSVVVSPIGFLSDHMEVLYDLDYEAAEAAKSLGLRFERAGTVGVHPRFIAMIRKLIEERISDDAPREAIGQYGANWDVCAANCCPAPMRPAVRGR